jgi:uncharacterized membrane protein YkgB
MTVKAFDRKIIHFFRKISMPVARIGFFVVFFWFGILKVIGTSPANGLVQQLLETTMPSVSFSVFVVSFGLFECLIGILFLKKGWERVVIPLLFIHMITTFLPLVLLPGVAWQSFLTPTLEGQYIIKNLILIAAGIGIAAHLHPRRK